MDKINHEEINRLDALYHKLFAMDTASMTVMPEILEGMSTLEIGIVNKVSSDPDIILREIADQLHIPNSTLTSALNRLERRGLAERIISPRDRRSFGIRLTGKGREAQEAHLAYEGSLWRAILGKLDTHKERERFLVLAEKIINGFEREGGLHG